MSDQGSGSTPPGQGGWGDGDQGQGDQGQSSGWGQGGQGGQQAGWGQPQGYGGYAPEKHPSATMVLVLGILGLVVCGFVAPFAWIKGNGVLREIDAQPGRYEGRDMVNVGRILGIVGSVLLIVGLVVFVFAMVVLVGAGLSTA